MIHTHVNTGLGRRNYKCLILVKFENIMVAKSILFNCEILYL